MAGPLLALPFALPSAGAAMKALLGYGALTAGGAAGGTALLGLNDGIEKELGLDPKNRAKNEKWDRATGEFDNYGIMDRIGSGLLGQTEQDLLDARLKADTADILSTHSGDIARIEGLLNQSNLPGLKALGSKGQLIGDRETKENFLSRIGQREAVATLLSEAINKHNLPQDRIAALVSKGTELKETDVQQAIGKWKVDNPDGLIQTNRNTQKQTNKVTNQQITESNAKIKDLTAGRGIQRDQLGLQQQGLVDARYNADENRRFQQWLESSRLRADTAARKDKMDLAALQIQQNSLDRQYMRERDARLDARSDRDKKLALILAAIGNIGRGFAV